MSGRLAGIVRTFFWIVWGWDLVLAAGFLYFFASDFLHGPLAPAEIGIRLMILAAGAALILLSLVLHRKTYTGAALVPALVVAVPGCAFAFFFVIGTYLFWPR